MSDRIARIQKMLQASPNDAFLHYSLGMEYASAGDLAAAKAAFLHVLELDGQYLPAYVEAGKCLRSAGELQQARELFEKGRQLAQSRGDAHMVDYIVQQLEGLAR